MRLIVRSRTERRFPRVLHLDRARGLRLHRQASVGIEAPEVSTGDADEDLRALADVAPRRVHNARQRGLDASHDVADVGDDAFLHAFRRMDAHGHQLHAAVVVRLTNGRTDVAGAYVEPQDP